MSALITQRSPTDKPIQSVALPLDASVKAFQGARLYWDTATGFVKPGVAGNAGLIDAGTAQQTVDNTAGGAGAAYVLTLLPDELHCQWVANAASNPVTALGGLCYVYSDHEVTASSSGNSVAGRVWALDPFKGVLVQSLTSITDTGEGLTSPATTTSPGQMPAANFAALSVPAANLAAIKAIPASARADGMIVEKRDDGSLWLFNAASTAVDSTSSVVITPTAGSGAWLRLPGVVSLTLPFTFATADAAVLFTVPAGCILAPRDAWWEIGTSMTGGASSAIGVHASRTLTAKGAVLGGSGGDVAATLVGAVAPFLEVGTEGSGMTPPVRTHLIATDTINFDRITSAFTAGAGNVRVLCDLIANLGA